MTTLENTVTERIRDPLEAPPLSIGQMAWLRFRRHKMAMLGAVMLIILFLYSFAGAFFYTESYANSTDTKLRLNSPHPSILLVPIPSVAISLPAPFMVARSPY